MRVLPLAVLICVVQTAPRPAQSVIRSRVTYVSTDVVVRDQRGQFVSDLRAADFEVYEDGARQAIAGFSLTHGGRLIADTPPASDAAGQGVLLPPTRPAADTSGRVFLIFVDDLHLPFHETGRLRDLLHRMSHELVHEGDLFGVVSTGPSSLALNLTYDRARLDEAIRRISGASLRPDEIIATPDGSQGPTEVRYRAHVAFSTAYEILLTFEQVHDRRKAFLYVSSGYDFDPFARSRARAGAERFYPTAPGDGAQVPDTNPFSKGGTEFAPAELAAELSELARQANRANTTIYTIDSRGLVGPLPDPSETKVDAADWQDHIRETQNSLRVLAELTGGFATINVNDFARALERIDGDMSDYYVLSYYSSNPDPLKKKRMIEIRIRTTPNRDGGRYRLRYKTSYTLKPG